MRRVQPWIVIATLICLAMVVFLVPTVMAQEKEAAGTDVSAVLEQFARDWPEDRKPHRHEEDTTSWMTFALSMKRLVALGDEAVPALIKACDDRNFQVRALDRKSVV